MLYLYEYNGNLYTCVYVFSMFFFFFCIFLLFYYSIFPILKKNRNVCEIKMKKICGPKKKFARKISHNLVWFFFYSFIIWVPEFHQIMNNSVCSIAIRCARLGLCWENRTKKEFFVFCFMILRAFLLLYSRWTRKVISNSELLYSFVEFFAITFVLLIWIRFFSLFQIHSPAFVIRKTKRKV